MRLLVTRLPGSGYAQLVQYTEQTKENIMSLNWSAKDVVNWEAVNTEENWPAIQNTIFYTMSLGISRITATNHIEFLERLLKFNAAQGTSAKDLKSIKDTYSTLLPNLVGLSTNASSKTVTAFNKYLLDLIQRHVDSI